MEVNRLIPLRWASLALICLGLAMTGFPVNAVEVSLTQGMAPSSNWLFFGDPFPSWLVFSITGAERIGRADFKVDLGIFEAAELKPVDASFQATFSSENGYLDVSIARTGIEPSPSVLYLTFGAYATSGRDPACGFGEIAFLSANLIDRNGDAISEVTLIPGSWYIPGYDYCTYIIVRVVDGQSSNPISGARVSLLGFVGGPGISDPDKGEFPPITDATGLASVMYPPDPAYLYEAVPNPGQIETPKACCRIKAWLRVEPTADVSVPFNTFDALVDLRVDEDRHSLSYFEEVTVLVGGPSAVEDWGLYE